MAGRTGMGAASRHDASRGKLDTTDQRGSGRISGVLRPRYAAPTHGARHRIRRPVPPSPPLDGYVTHTGGRFPGLRVIAPVPPSQDFHPSGAGWTGTRRSQLRGQPWLRPTESALHVPFIPFREPTVPAFSQSRHRRSIQSAADQAPARIRLAASTMLIRAGRTSSQPRVFRPQSGFTQIWSGFSRSRALASRPAISSTGGTRGAWMS